MSEFQPSERSRAAYLAMEKDLTRNVAPVADTVLKGIVPEGEAMFHGDSSEPALYVTVPEGTTTEDMERFLGRVNQELASQHRSLELRHGQLEAGEGQEAYEYLVKTAK